jgi:hypothetical protein
LPLFMSAWQNDSSQTFFFIRFMRVSCRSRSAECQNKRRIMPEGGNQIKKRPREGPFLFQRPYYKEYFNIYGFRPPY